MKRAEKLKYIGFNDTWFMLIGIPFLGLLIPPLGKNVPIGWNMEYFINALVSMAYCSMYWFIGRELTVRMRKRCPDWEKVGFRMARVILFIVPFSVVVCFFTAWLEGTSFTFVGTVPMVIMTTILTVMILAMYESIYYFIRFRDLQVETEKWQKERAQMQLEALRAQVDPHFLFNSLNTATELVAEDPKRAEDYIQSLSKVYRYILETRDRELVRVEEELQFLNSYRHLLQTRFGDKLNIEINLPSGTMNQGIVPFALQLLVENAIKHNVVSSKQPLDVRIALDEANQSLVVSNPLQPKLQSVVSTGTGLQNLRRSYGLLSDGVVEILEQAGNFVVKLPILPSVQVASAQA
jgi:hypothetical protein